jgi:predicted nucleotidyltransferase
VQQSRVIIDIMDINIPKLDTIIPIIVSLASPDQIILFGSYARGKNNEKSDIDLLVLKKGLKNNLDVIDSIYRAFFNQKIGIAVDLLAIDYNRYLEINNDIGYVYKTIKKEGKDIYDTL